MLNAASAYRILGVSPLDSPRVVRAAYHRRAKECHHDLNHRPESAERMKRLNLAYEVVSEALRASQPGQMSCPSPHTPMPRCPHASVASQPPPRPPQSCPSLAVRRRSWCWLIGWTFAFSLSAAWLWLAEGGLWFALPVALAAWAVAEWLLSQ